MEQAKSLKIPSHIVGAVPEYDAVTPEEKVVKTVPTFWLAREGKKGVMLDMCYHPTRQTRNLRLAEHHGWRTVQGIEVVGHQVEALWRFWISEDRLSQLDKEGMWRVLREAADLDWVGRQALNTKILKQHFKSDL